MSTFIDKIEATLSMNIAKYQASHCGNYPEKIFVNNLMFRYMQYSRDFKWSASCPSYSYKNIPVSFYESENGRLEFYFADWIEQINL